MRRVTVKDGFVLAQRFRWILFDIDGVVWRGSEPVEGAPAALQQLHAAGTFVRFVTNNASLTRTAVAEKLASLGMLFVTPTMVYSSAYATAHVLRRALPRMPRPNVWVVGEVGLHEELRAILPPTTVTKGQGARLEGGAYHPSVMARAATAPLLYCDGCETPTSVSALDLGAVVMGMDRAFDMTRLAVATMALQESGTVFIATNEDPQFPADGGVQLPGAGCLVKALVTAVGRSPDVTCGKPHGTMAEVLRETENVQDPAECLMIGDRVSDIQFGRRAGFATMLVLSGCDGVAEVEAAGGDGIPDYVADSVAVLALMT